MSRPLVRGLLIVLAMALAAVGLADAAGTTVRLVPLPSPARLFDSRPGAPTVDGQGRPGDPLRAGEVVVIQATGRGGVPAGSTSIVATITSTNTSAPSFLTASSGEGPRPLASQANPAPGRTIATTAVIVLAANGTFAVYNHQGATDVVIDVASSQPPGGDLTAVTPARLLETRPGQPTVDGRGAARATRRPG